MEAAIFRPKEAEHQPILMIPYKITNISIYYENKKTPKIINVFNILTSSSHSK
jgi:hypothetical protein